MHDASPICASYALVTYLQQLALAIVAIDPVAAVRLALLASECRAVRT